MMWLSSDLKGTSIDAIDGKIGSVSDLLFDDTTWMLRWLVVDTGAWLPGRLVLLHPSVLGEPDQVTKTLPVSLTREKVEASPDIQQDLPVSRQMEQGVFAHYGWDPYWGGGAFGMDALATPFSPAGAYMDPMLMNDLQPHEGDPHLRSVRSTSGYHIHAMDGEIGHASDVLVDTKTWRITYLIVDTRNWWPGKHVLLAPQAVTEIDWSAQTINVNVSKEKIQSGPEWNPETKMDEAQERSLRAHYGWPDLLL